MVVESGVEDDDRANTREDWLKKQKPRGVASGPL